MTIDRVLRLFLLTRPKGCGMRTKWMSLILTLLIGLFVTIIDRGGLFNSFPTISDSHTKTSFQMALHRIEFGKSCVQGQSRTILQDPSNSLVMHCKVINLIDLAGLPRKQYELGLTPILNNENSTSLLLEFAMRVFPFATVQEIVIVLNAMRLSCFLFFTYTLLRLGAPILFTTLLFVVAVVILEIIDQTHAYSCYANILPSMLLFIATASWCFHSLTLESSRLLKILFHGLLLGMVAALTWNFRTTCFPAVFFICVLICGVGYLRLRNRSSYNWFQNALPSLLFGVVVIVGAGISQKLIIQYTVDPIPDSVKMNNYTYHAIWHPIVLSLALPSNDFATSKGIIWLDEVGLKLARSIDPVAVYLGETYESALMIFYLKLWIFHPAEMKSIYYNKFQFVGTDIVNHGYWNQADSNYTNIKAITRLLFIWINLVKNGVSLIIISFIILVTSMTLTVWYKASNLTIIYFGIIVFGVLNLIESALTVQIFSLLYNSPEIYYFSFVGALLFQAFVIGLSMGIDRAKFKFWNIPIPPAQTIWKCQD